MARRTEPRHCSTLFRVTTPRQPDDRSAHDLFESHARSANRYLSEAIVEAPDDDVPTLEAAKIYATLALAYAIASHTNT